MLDVWSDDRDDVRYALAYCAEYNFAEQAAEKGCASVITQRGQDECKREQQKKDDACNVSVEDGALVDAHVEADVTVAACRVVSGVRRIG
jgi:hypothetical protein